MSYCSPKRNKLKKDRDTCLDDQIINDMVDLYNQSSSREKIDKNLGNMEKIKLLETKLKDEMPCDQEYCLQYSPRFKSIQKRLKEYYRPVVPKEWRLNNRAWLNTLDILENLKQYNEAYPDFHFLTVSAIDFDYRIGNPFMGGETCVDRNLCALDLANYFDKDKRKFGAVFNLDKHNQSGSHWTSMYIDLNLGEAYYFDSVANTTPPEIINLMTRITAQGGDLIHSGKLKLANFDSRLKIGVQSNRAIVSMTELCNFLIKEHNFINYRYGYLFGNVPMTKFNIKATDELAEAIIKKTLQLIDLTKKDGYGLVPDIDQMLANYKGKTDQFVLEWVQSQVSIAISNLVSSIKIVGDNQNQYYVLDFSVDGSNIIFQLDRHLQSSNSLTDVSMKCFRNYVQHQFKNTECGMYSINFIDSLLTQGKKFTDIVLNPMNDDVLNSLRYSKYFTPE